MNPAPRWSLCALTAVSVLLGILAARPHCARREGFDVWDSLEFKRRVERGRQELGDVKGRVARAYELSRRREQVADAVCERRMGLLEAAAHFRRLNADDEAGRSHQVHFAGDSEEERCCRHVIELVRRRLERESPEEAARRTAELEHELADYLSSRK
jgi:hypothetical protein